METDTWSDYEREYFHPQIRYIADITKDMNNICLLRSNYKPQLKFTNTHPSFKIKMTTRTTEYVEPFDGNFYKVIVSVFISGPRHSLYHKQKLVSKVFMNTEREWYSDNFIAFGVNSRFEMESLYSYLRSWVVSDLFSIGKKTRNVSENSFVYIPLVPLDRIWESDDIIRWISLHTEKPRKWLRELPTGLDWCGIDDIPI
jgi:hypothetical protein